MYKEVVGVVGGFGAYATLDFYKRFLEVFASDNERNYPRIIMDNNFTMPSRTRALLYDEGIEEIIELMVQSVEMLIHQGATKIVMVCGTAHFFYDEVIRRVPQAAGILYNIIEVMVQKMIDQKVNNVGILAAEGCLYKNVYDIYMRKYGISYCKPEREQYGTIRYFIEAVKKDKITDEIALQFAVFIKTLCKQEGIRDIILGCTEFPILLDYLKSKKLDEEIEMYCFWNPLEQVLDNIAHTIR